MPPTLATSPNDGRGGSHLFDVPPAAPPPRPPAGGNASSAAADQSDLLVVVYRLDRVQSLSSLVAVLVSMTALLVCLVVYVLFPALRGATAGRCLICLIVCLFSGQLLYLGAALHGFGALDVVGDSSARAELCYWLAVATHYVLLAGAFWLNVIAMDSARTASADSEVSLTTRHGNIDILSACRAVIGCYRGGDILWPPHFIQAA